MRQFLLGCLLASSLVAFSVTTADARDLTFDQRVQAQEAIERVYYSYRTGSRKTFEQAVPRGVIEGKVRRYLKQTVALEQLWRTPVTADMLQRETRTMMGRTRMPERLGQLFAALGDDPILVQECLVRPLLVDRLMRSFHGRGDPKAAHDEWWVAVRGSFDESLARSAAEPLVDLDLGLGSSCAADDTWGNGVLDDLLVPRREHTAVWTGDAMLVWGGSHVIGNQVFGLGDGARYDPVTDSWTPTSTIGAPSPRYGHVAIWSGDSMLVWGGRSLGGYPSDGGRYDPLTDSWTPMSTVGAPAGRLSPTGVWTGNLLLVWGGWDGALRGDGGRYDAASDTWAPISQVFDPSPRIDHTAVWSGAQMIVWGGNGANGRRYDPATDGWTSISVVDAPPTNSQHSAIWTGDRMIVWGASTLEGGQYDPVSDSWTATSTVNAPSPRWGHDAVWTGDRMIVWGGQSQGGGVYDPVADSWTAMSTLDEPYRRRENSAIWAGNRMIVWGGHNSFGSQSGYFNDGGRYDPVGDTWTPTSLYGAPTGRRYHTAIWDGARMIVWGGSDGFGNHDTGACYDPATDHWSPTTTIGAPPGRARHTAVWSGDEMLIWDGSSPLGDGARYDPTADVWAPISTIGAPSNRSDHSAVWTGVEMIVWGGGLVGQHNDGARYDPDTDTWQPISLVDAPGPRHWHSAVWAGSEMIVWGGREFNTVLDTGGRYDPVSDSWTALPVLPDPAYLHTAVWTGSEMLLVSDRSQHWKYTPSTDLWSPLSTTGEVSARSQHAAVWTEERMIVWGGQFGLMETDSGAMYDPVTDTWWDTSISGAPLPRGDHTAVWTGSSMLVWGGWDGNAYFNNGGRYALGHSTDDDGDGFAECAGDCNDDQITVFAGAPEICDGLDNDCGGQVDDIDLDGDGFSACSLDCDDTDSGAHAIPGEITGLRFDDGRVTLRWDSAAGSGSASVHDVVTGDLRKVSMPTASTCLAMGISEAQADDTAEPDPGKGFWYLVRGRNGCGSSGYGTTSDGTPRVSGACP